jgi:hypothetical protein
VSAIVEGFDAAAINGAALSAQTGILNTTGTIPVDATAGWTNLDPFVQAKAALRAAGATASAIFIHPLDYEIAGKLKKATGSNESLLAGQSAPTSALPSRCSASQSSKPRRCHGTKW